MNQTFLNIQYNSPQREIVGSPNVTCAEIEKPSAMLRQSHNVLLSFLSVYIPRILDFETEITLKH